MSDLVKRLVAEGSQGLDGSPGDPLALEAAHRISDLESENAELRRALCAAKRLFDEALPKFDWGRSALDANAIKLLNEVPALVNAALASQRSDTIPARLATAESLPCPVR
jgi:hypothetical protein